MNKLVSSTILAVYSFGVTYIPFINNFTCKCNGENIFRCYTIDGINKVIISAQTIGIAKL